MNSILHCSITQIHDSLRKAHSNPFQKRTNFVDAYRLLGKYIRKKQCVVEGSTGILTPRRYRLKMHSLYFSNM